MELFSEGEGGLSSADSRDRKTEKDFALWKVWSLILEHTLTFVGLKAWRAFLGFPLGEG
jgi:hypothetical protein